MRKFFTILIKIIGLLILLIGSGVISYFVAKKMQWPIWSAVIIFASIFSVILFILFLRKYLLRKRERRFIERIIERDRAVIESAPEIKRLKLLELQEHWKESVEKLQSSHLRKYGNPLYVLPWFMVMGESQNGKTSTIKNAHITSAITEISRASGISGTRNCDWWFCDEAIILDTAGRYSIPVDEGPDLEEWKEFLHLLAKYRKKEPLNGVIVVVSADNLLNRDDNTLKEIGQSIRLRIDQLMKTLGAKFPVYVMVTKMDLVHGFTHFAELLPEETLNQAMGYTNQKFNISYDEILRECQTVLLNRLNELRFLLVNKYKELPPGTIMFPIEFEKLFPKLKSYLEGLFEENQYQETPLFRGIYFSSALVKGSPVSEFLELTNIKNRYKHGISSEGIFLKDFFAKILPKDRNLFAPILEFLRWKKLVNNLGLLVYLLVMSAVIGALSLSFYKNYEIINTFKSSIKELPKLTGNKVADLILLDELRFEIMNISEQNKDWFIPRFGFNQSYELEEKLKKHFCSLFKKGFLDPIDKKLMNVAQQVNKNTPVKEFVDYIGYAVVRASILRNVLEGKTESNFLKKDFLILTKAVFEIEGKKGLEVIPQKFATVYNSYLQWDRQRIDFYEKLRNYEKLILNLLHQKGENLFWLVDDTIANAPRVHLNMFWEKEFIGKERNIIFIPGAYTAEGRNNIKRFLLLLEHSLTDKEMLERFRESKQKFWKWYVIEFFNTWHSFIKDFNEGMNRIDKLSKRQKLVFNMVTMNNPYLLFIEKFNNELISLEKDVETKGLTPLWVAEFKHLYKVINLAKTLKEKQKGSIVGTLKAKEEKIIGDIDKKIDKKAAKEEARLFIQAHTWNEYINSLKKIELGVLSMEDAYKLFAACFEEPSNQTKLGLMNAYEKYYKFRTIMNDRFEFADIYDLAFGPLGFLLEFASRGTRCYLQRKWEEMVLSVIEDVDPDRLNDVLFDKDMGVVWKYVNGVAKPFIGKNSGGYFARKAFVKQSVPFEKSFLNLLNKGAIVSANKKSKYYLTIKTVPVTVNDDAKIEPFYSSLTVNCANKVYVLDNYNFLNKISLEWSPKTCGNTVLTIKFPDVVLRKKYTGKLAFSRFLNDFKAGSKTFFPEDFSKNKEYLKRINVSWIKVSFNFEGDFLDIVNLITKIPKNIPKKIVECPWN
ncbi:type VI secretion protein IcmF/TssM N-terminal domain-containing protein [Deferribacter abyssi]|uniref:type VI secretion protein IcmF/TssM N-terminal domain-containing protein n=1 Tax=Deferribacter abyssi TaxID=213806 RepID=UPI003C19DC4A